MRSLDKSAHGTGNGDGKETVSINSLSLFLYMLVMKHGWTNTVVSNNNNQTKTVIFSTDKYSNLSRQMNSIQCIQDITIEVLHLPVLMFVLMLMIPHLRRSSMPIPIYSSFTLSHPIIGWPSCMQIDYECNLYLAINRNQVVIAFGN